jgi:hypothetical protein
MLKDERPAWSHSLAPPRGEGAGASGAQNETARRLKPGTPSASLRAPLTQPTPRERGEAFRTNKNARAVEGCAGVTFVD